MRSILLTLVTASFITATGTTASAQSCGSGSCHWLYLNTSASAHKGSSEQIEATIPGFYDCVASSVSNNITAATSGGSSSALATVSENFAAYGILRQSGSIEGHWSEGAPGISSGISGGTGIIASFNDTLTITYPGTPPGGTVAIKLKLQTSGTPAYGWLTGLASLSYFSIFARSDYPLPSGSLPWGGSYSITVNLAPGSYPLLGELRTYSGSVLAPSQNYLGNTAGAIRVSIELVDDIGSISLCSGASYPTCVADMNFDGIVDDADYVIFAAAYNTLQCPLDENENPISGCAGDLDGDGDIDDDDFVLFAIAYNLLVCG